MERIIFRNGKYPFESKERIYKGSLNSSGYYRVQLFKNGISKTKIVHQLVAISFLNHTPCGLKLVVNHINFIRTDNRVKNLEIVTNRENSNKIHIKSSSKYIGVCFVKSRNNWRSRILIDGKRISLGTFRDEVEASNAYTNALQNLTNSTSSIF